MFRMLDERTLVTGQIAIDDITDAAAQGVTMIVNNRPDHEEPGQLTSAEIEAAARAAGLDYRHIPVAGGLNPTQIDAMAEALGGADGKTLAFCKAGTRSTYLWALAQSSRGVDGDTLIAQAAGAGYDLSPLRPHLS